MYGVSVLTSAVQVWSLAVQQETLPGDIDPGGFMTN